MGYGGKNFNFFGYTDENGVVIDGCGNTSEDKHYYNGMYIDLCGMSVEEYMKNPCCSSADSESSVDKTGNEISIVTFTGDDGKPYYQAKAAYPVTTNLQVSVTSENGEITILDIFAGTSESVPEVGASLTFKKYEIDVEADDNYVYVTTTEMENIDGPFVIYYATPFKPDLANITSEAVQQFASMTLERETTGDLKFVIPATDVNYNDLEEREFNLFGQENQYAFFFVLPKNLYEEKAYIVTNYGGTVVTDSFKAGNTFVLNNKEYISLIEQARNDIWAFVPQYNEDTNVTYKLTITK
jgi:hypothetical protein